MNSEAFDFLGAPAPRWFTIAAHRPFLRDLAGALWRRLAAEGSEALADALILVPTRRAARALAEAFVAASGAGAVFPPMIRALGDLEEGEPPFSGLQVDWEDELAPEIDPLRRRFELAALVAAHHVPEGGRLGAGAAMALADALASFLDGCLLEECGDPTAVDALVAGDLARHWQASARFLNIALEAWPRRLDELGLTDPPARRVALLRRLAARWSREPPPGVVIAAGSTGSTPAVADLLAVIARAPRGCVVLPGLDLALAEEAWRAVDEAHPQGAMKRLLVRAGLDREAVRPWDRRAERETRGRWRRRLINEAMRPAAATGDWLAQIAALAAESPKGDAVTRGFAGLSLVATRDDDEAASVAALLLREQLETPGATAALVTPDAALARRVGARLSRWGVEAASSLGAPLAASPPAVLATLLARAAADPLAPVTLLSIAKHPLVQPPIPEAERPAAALDLERQGLRGVRPSGWETLEARLAGRAGALALTAFVRAAVSSVAAPFAASGAAPAGAAARALAGTMETLCAEAFSPWRGRAGEALARMIGGLIRQSDALPPVTAAGFADLLDALMAGETVANEAGHPRVAILGVLEARLAAADRLVLAGLEEGLWPRGGGLDPFLSRPMREQLRLPPPERRIGLAAHDFAQAACADEVVLITRDRRGGAPAVASRWIWRLRVLAEGARAPIPGRPDVLAWARALDAPLASPPPSLRPASRPAPTPPVEARPKRLSVTRVEQWLRDPYAIYAERILRLKPLAAPDEAVDARARGSAIHRAFEDFARAWSPESADDAGAIFARLYMDALRGEGVDEVTLLREQALGANLGQWVAAFERNRRRAGPEIFLETRGVLELAVGGGRFTLTATADRIEVHDGVADIIDFKTGAPPGKKEVEVGFAPQLTLTAAILAAGGFADIGACKPGELLYVRASGGREPGEVKRVVAAGESVQRAEAALEQLRAQVARFTLEATPYLSWAAPKYRLGGGGDYDHLARVWEWMVIGEADAEGEAA